MVAARLVIWLAERWVQAGLLNTVTSFKGTMPTNAGPLTHQGIMLSGLPVEVHGVRTFRGLFSKSYAS
jgi:hypothetical protein